jgi:hypothetical protein
MCQKAYFSYENFLHDRSKAETIFKQSLSGEKSKEYETQIVQLRH